jgi:hypothetical protein
MSVSFDPKFIKFSTVSVSTLLDGLLAYWKLDEASGNVADSSGNGRTGVATDLTYSQAGKQGTAVTFNGTTSVIDVTDNPDLGSTTNAFTIAFWYKGTDIEGRIITAGCFRVYQGDGINSILLADGTNNIEFNFSVALNDNAWHFVVITFDGTNILAYDNNSNILTDTWAHTLGFWSDHLYMMNNGDVIYTAGTLDEVGFWNRAINSTERAALYNAGAGKTYPF